MDFETGKRAKAKAMKKSINLILWILKQSYCQTKPTSLKYKFDSMDFETYIHPFDFS